MIGITIRPFAEADAAACTRIFDSAWHAGHPYAPRTIDLSVLCAETEGEQVLVAEAQGHGIAGFATLYAPENFIHHLYVEPSLQGCGIGTTLLDAALARAGGPASLKCQTRNTAALDFYRRRGWRPGEAGESEFGPWVRMLSPPGAGRGGAGVASSSAERAE